MKPVGSCCLLSLLSACGSEANVLLNERIFDLHSMQSAGSSCVAYDIDDGSESSSSTSFEGMSISQTAEDGGVLVRVTEEQSTLTVRGYGEDFFDSERLDEFTVSSSSGRRLLLRYWGMRADSIDFCTPLDQDRPNQ